MTAALYVYAHVHVTYATGVDTKECNMDITDPLTGTGQETHV